MGAEIEFKRDVYAILLKKIIRDDGMVGPHRRGKMSLLCMDIRKKCDYHYPR